MRYTDGIAGTETKKEPLTGRPAATFCRVCRAVPARLAVPFRQG